MTAAERDFLGKVGRGARETAAATSTISSDSSGSAMVPAEDQALLGCGGCRKAAAAAMAAVTEKATAVGVAEGTAEATVEATAAERPSLGNSGVDARSTSTAARQRQ